MAYRVTLFILLLAVMAKTMQSSRLKDEASRLSWGEQRVQSVGSLYGNSLVVARYANVQNLTDNFDVGVEINDEIKTIKCSISFEAKTNVLNRGVAAIKRLAEYKVLITTFYEFRTGEPKFLLTLLDLNGCECHCPLSKYLPASYAIFTPDEDCDILMVVVISGTFCWPHNTCILAFDHNHSYSEYRAFDIELVRGISVEPLSMAFNDTQQFVVRGYNTDNIYKKLIYRVSVNNRQSTIEEVSIEQPTDVHLDGYELSEHHVPSACAGSCNFEIYLCIASISLVLYAIARGMIVGFKCIRINE